jgi:lipopolysaccharide export system permease protein
VRLRILDRMVIGQFLRLFLGFVLSAPLLFILGDATENLDRYMSEGVTLENALLAYLYQYPQFIFWAFPIASLLATVFTIHPMTAHSEIMAAKAGGIPFHRITLPMYVLGVILTVVGVGLSELTPLATRAAAELRGDRSVQEAWRTDFVYLTDSGQSLSARRLTVNDGRLLEVSLQELPRESDAPIRYLKAAEARWMEGDGWRFQDGFIREIFADDRELMIAFESALVRSVEESPEELLQESRNEEEMTYGELRQFSERLARSGGNVGRTLTKIDQRFAIPVATFIVILFGAPLATSSKRGGAAYGVGISLATTIVYLMLFRVSGGLGYAGTFDPTLAAWLPNGVFLVSGLALLSRVRT